MKIAFCSWQTYLASKGAPLWRILFHLTESPPRAGNVLEIEFLSHSLGKVLSEPLLPQFKVLKPLKESASE